MIEIFIYKSRPNLHYVKISGEFTLEDTHSDYLYNYNHISTKEHVISIVHFVENATLSDFNVIKDLAHTTQTFKHCFLEASVVGLTGIQKMFFQAFTKLTPNLPYPIFLHNSLEEVEQKYTLSFKKFERVFP